MFARQRPRSLNGVWRRLMFARRSSRPSEWVCSRRIALRRVLRRYGVVRISLGFFQLTPCPSIEWNTTEGSFSRRRTPFRRIGRKKNYVIKLRLNLYIPYVPRNINSLIQYCRFQTVSPNRTGWYFVDMNFQNNSTFFECHGNRMNHFLV